MTVISSIVYLAEFLMNSIYLNLLLLIKYYIRFYNFYIFFREKRFEQERILLSQQIANLDEALAKKTNDLQMARSESSARILVFQTKLVQCEEELKICNESIAHLQESNSMFQRRSEELNKKLDEQRNQELAMHSSYREEISAQTRLADLYKGMMEEANSKANDYSNAVKDLQNLLEHATEQYGILESKYKQSLLDHNQEIVIKQSKIDELTKELNYANDLIKTIKQGSYDNTYDNTCYFFSLIS